LFGLRITGPDTPLYLRNLSLFVLPLLTAYFVWKRGSSPASSLWLVLPFLVGALFANVYPLRQTADTARLTALHLPIALWLVVGIAYVRGGWLGNGGRMDFVRFSGELTIYFALIALGGGVFTAVTMMMFNAIQVKADWLAGGWLVPCGGMGAVIIGSWLV